MFARAVNDAARFYRRSWWYVALVQLVGGLLVAIPLAFIAQIANLIVAARGQELALDGSLPAFAVALLIVSVVVCLPLALVGVSATVRTVNDSLAGRQRRLGASLAEGFARIPALAAAASLTVVGAVALIVLSPVLTVLGLVALLLTPLVVLVRRRREGFLGRWPALVTLAWVAAPLGLALRFVAGAMFFAPAVVLERLGPIAALRAGAAAARPRRLRLVAFVVLGLLASVALQMAASWLGSEVLGAAGGLTAQVLLQVFLVALPVVLVTVLFRLGRATAADGSLPASRTVAYATSLSALPPRRRRAPRAVPGVVRRVAFAMPFVVLIAGLGLAPTAASAAPAPGVLSLTVTTSADPTDSATLSAQAANCLSGSGDCSLRAAAQAAGTAAGSGTYGSITIGFDGSRTIALAAPISVTNLGTSGGAGGEGGEGEGGGEGPAGAGGLLTVDGSGGTVVLDGQSATQVLEFHSNSWGLQLSHLQISNGRGTFGGGASITTPAASYVDSVTFDGNVADTGGGALYVSGSAASIVNSTFANNGTGNGSADGFPNGGGDIYALYSAQVAINNSSFANFSHGSIFSWAAASATTSVSNSVFDVRSGLTLTTCDGGGGYSGTSNVIVGADASCPGTTPSSGPALGDLHQLPSGGPAVMPLIPDASNPAIGGAGAAGVECEPVDQRGATRPTVGCDAGAVEIDPASSTTLASSLSSTPYGADVTFTAAVSLSDGGSAVNSGAVAFAVDGVEITPAVQVSGGAASVTLDSLAAGTHSVTATYVPADPAIIASSQSSPLAHEVTKLGSTVVIGSSLTPALVSDTVTVTAAVTSQDPAVIPSGTVTLRDTTAGSPGVLVGTATTLVDGSAQFDVSNLAAGRHALVASYAGDDSNLAATSATLEQVTRVESSTQSGVTSTAVEYGGVETVSVSVPRSGALPVPTGTVTLTWQGGTRVVTLDATGAASALLADIALGSTEIRATYSGDDRYAPSSATPIPVTVTAAITTTALAAADDSIAYGVPAPLTATVSRANGTAPVGTVTFSSGGNDLQTVAVAPGTGSSSTATYIPAAGELPVGDRALSAHFTPDYGYAASTSSPLAVTVSKAGTTVTVTSSLSPAPANTPVTLTATVSGTGGSTAVPEGTVEFFSGSTSLGTAQLSGGTATRTESFGPGSPRTITVRYLGSASFTEATSPAITQTVEAAAVVTALTVTPGIATHFGTALRFDVDVKGAANGLPATGTVVVRDGSTVVATIPLVDGAGSKSIDSPSAGSHSYRATFTPSGSDFSGGVSAVVTHTVGVATTSTALTFSKPSSVQGDPVTLTATVSATDAVPAGTVTFSVGGEPLGTADVVGGVASLTAGLQQSADFPQGLRDIVATYNPTSDFGASSSTVPYAVARGTVSVSFALVGTEAGSPQSLVATVTTLTGTGSPVGSIAFSGGTGASGSAPLVNGVATLTGVTLPAGSRLVQAFYSSRDRNFDEPVPNTVSSTVVVAQGTPTVALTTDSSGPLPYGAPVVLTAQVSTVVANPVVKPSGAVRFTATGPLGSFDLGSATVGGTGAATLTTRAIPLGTQSVVADYLGDGNLLPATSAALSQVVTQATTTTTVTAAPAPTLPGQTITLSARVSSPGATVASGTVQFVVDGRVVATVAVNGSGAANYSLTEGSVRTLAIEARYSSASGDFAASTGSTTHAVVPRDVNVVLRSDTSQASVGQTLTFGVVVSARGDYPQAPPGLPTGSVVVSDGKGTSCTIALAPGLDPGTVEGTCSLAYPSAGIAVFRASYAGDQYFAATVSAPSYIVVSTKTTGVRLTSPGRWIEGQSVSLDWAVVGPTAANGSMSIRSNGVVVCSSTALSGTCAYTVPSSTAEVTLVMIYSGTSEWSSASTMLTKQITSCVRVGQSSASPSNGGTVSLVSAPNCGADGFLPGSYVDFRAVAAEGFTFAHWSQPDQTAPIISVLAQQGGAVRETAFFSRPCVEVTFTVLGGTGYGANEIVSSTPSNCGAGWIRSDYRSRTGTFQVGTQIALRAYPPSGADAVELYGWDGLAPGADVTAATQVYTVTPAMIQEVTASFGIRCAHDLRAAQPTGGSVTLGGPNCYDNIGAGYKIGSSIPVSTSATGDAYFSQWRGNIRPLTSSATGATGTVTVYATNPEVSATYSQCLSFSVSSTGYTYLSGGDGYQNGKATANPTGNCPNKGAGWYLPGSKISISTTGERGKTFGGWQTTLPLQAMATTATNYLTLETSGTATALWYAANQCKPYTVTAIQPDWLTVSSTLSGGDQGCPDGQLNSALMQGQGQQLTVSATATQGDPLIGWSGISTRWKDSSLTAPTQIVGTTENPRTVGVASTASLTAWSCQQIATTFTLVSPNGTAHSEPLPGGTDFVGADPAPNCPIAASAYTIGQDVFPQALETSPGYTFVGWSGAVNSTDEFPTTPVVIDGASKTISLTATYKVNCYKLTTNTQHTKVETAPNCPDTDASENMYIGGTVITLQTIGNAGTKVFRGFTGDLDGQSGIFAWVSITKDSAVYSNYETRGAGEAIKDALTDAGNDVAITAKKAVGVAAAAVAAFVIGDNPVLMVASLVVLLGKGVQGIADAFGLSSDGLVAFTGGITALEQMLTFMQAGATCATVWSAAGSDRPLKDISTTGLGMVGTVAANRLIEAKDSAAAVRDAQRSAQSAAMAAAYDARLSNLLLSGAESTAWAGKSTLDSAKATYASAKGALAKPLEWAGRLGDVALVGYTSYLEFSGPSAGWDADATSAWTTGGDVYANCLMDAIPPYFGVPARTK